MIGYATTQAIITIVALFVGFTFGRIGRRGAAQAVEPEPVSRPICMCKHIYTLHKNGGKCHNQYCDCHQYLGPDPILSGLWSPPPPEKKPK